MFYIYLTMFIIKRYKFDCTINCKPVRSFFKYNLLFIASLCVTYVYSRWYINLFIICYIAASIGVIYCKICNKNLDINLNFKLYFSKYENLNNISYFFVLFPLCSAFFVINSQQTLYKILCKYTVPVSHIIFYFFRDTFNFITCLHYFLL